jgi:NAD(P)-dependent dehydrogenase (short-subunit alcohol dehydrogenase family)/acyl dehydratase/putative sterol carrier protein
MALLSGLVAIVTGGGQGLGKQHCLALAAAGARVVINDLASAQNPDGSLTSAAELVAQEIQAAGGEAVANTDSVTTWEGAERIIKAAILAFGRLDILVNNAGILRDKTLLKMTEAMWDDVIAVHLKGAFLCSRLAAEQFVKQGDGGRIINTSSLAGLKGNIGQSNYGAAKAGIFGLTRVTSMELARARVTVNAIAPVALTAMTENLGVLPPHMTADKVSPLVVFLASPLAEDITGRTFGIHGNELFEYRMEQTRSLDKDPSTRWTAEEIAAALPDLDRKPAAASAAADSAQTQQIKTLFAAMPSTFKPEKATGWAPTLHFIVGDVASFTLTIANGHAAIQDGTQGRPSCVVTFNSADTFIGLVQGKLKADQAFMSGKIKASDMADLMKFSRAFDLTKLAAAPAAEAAAAPAAEVPAGMNKDLIGKHYRMPAAFVLAEEVDAYARASSDLNPLYLSAPDAPAKMAPPLFAVRAAHHVLMGAVTDPDLRADLLNLVHGEQDMRFLSPIKPWDLIAARGEITSIEDKSSGQLLTLTTRLMRDGDPVCEIKSGIFVRDRSKTPPKPAPKPAAAAPATPPAPPEPPTYLFEEVITVDADQPLRYAEASGDHNPIHVDDAVAKSAGHPSVILHGLCTMAFCQKAIVDRLVDSPEKLTRLSVRFARPVLPGDALTTRAWLIEARDDSLVIGFETTNSAGVKVITNGVAEVRR